MLACALQLLAARWAADSTAPILALQHAADGQHGRPVAIEDGAGTAAELEPGLSWGIPASSGVARAGPVAVLDMLKRAQGAAPSDGSPSAAS